MDKFLAESDTYKIYSLDESVYLKNKDISKVNKYDKEDLFIDSFYGEPNSGLISADESYFIIGGNKVIIYELETKRLVEIKYFEGNWVSGFFQDISEDKEWSFVRFVGYNENEKLRVFKLNILDFSISEVM